MIEFKLAVIMPRLVFLIAILLAGCQFDPYTREYTQSPVAKSDVVGRYSLDAESRDWLAREFSGWSPAPRLTLSRDGQFILTGMPSCWKEFECKHGKTQNIVGSWDVEKLDDYWAVALNVTAIDSAPERFFTAAQLRREKPPYIVHFIVGDPDEGRGLAFAKTAN